MALWHHTLLQLGARGPVRVLSLVIFLQETEQEEEEGEKKKWPEG